MVEMAISLLLRKSEFPLRRGGATNTRGAAHEGQTGQAARSSVLSCTAWGLSGHFRCRKCGGLLPRHFTLTGRERPAVSFL
jgi:hypothetical protein